MRPDRRSWPARLRERTPGVFVMPGSRRAGPGPALFGRDESRKRKKEPRLLFGVSPASQEARDAIWSGKRDSNSRPQPWQGCALPTELFPLGSRAFYTPPRRCASPSLQKNVCRRPAACQVAIRPFHSRFCGVGADRPAGATRNRGRPILNAANVDHGEVRSGMAASLNRNAFSASTRPLMAAHRQPATQPRRYFSGFSGSLPCSALSCRQVFKGCAVAATIVVTSWVSSRARTLRQAQP